jgi:uncharacterized RDD family membrane protein YckC
MSTPNPYAPPQAPVADFVDPRAAAGGAGRLIRLAAWFLDWLIFLTVTYLPLFLGGLGTLIGQALEGNMDAPNIAPAWSLVSSIAFIAWFVGTLVLMARSGQSIAKKLLGIKVVRSDGSQASLGRLFWLRNVVNLLLMIVPFYWLIDPLFIFGERRQCLHDKLADTIVVRA